jgi:hypothetical protein
MRSATHTPGQFPSFLSLSPFLLDGLMYSVVVLCVVVVVGLAVVVLAGAI